jgi:uncharacterized membrane protein YgcG
MAMIVRQWNHWQTLKHCLCHEHPIVSSCVGTHRCLKKKTTNLSFSSRSKAAQKSPRKSPRRSRNEDNDGDTNANATADGDGGSGGGGSGGGGGGSGGGGEAGSRSIVLTVNIPVAKTIKKIKFAQEDCVSDACAMV